MSLFLAFALMTAAAIFAVLWPLARRGKEASGTSLSVYRDQLDEIGRDQAAGLIGPAEAEAARVEVSRRLLASAEADGTPRAVASPAWRRRLVAVIALVLLPVVATGTYLALGSPQLPGQPLATRTRAPNPDASIESLVAQVEARLQASPDDWRGWEVLAPIYLRTGRPADAVAAWRHVIALDGDTAERQANFGEAQVAAANGVVTADAKTAFDRALALDPRDVKARYFTGLAAEQDGRFEDAAATWRALLASASADAPWAEFVRNALERVQAIPEMVARLAARLEENRDDVDGWLRLVRSYAVMKQPEKARAAAAQARTALAGEPDKVRRLDELTRQLGLGE